MIKCVGELTCKNNEFAAEMSIFLQNKNFLLEPIYTDKLIIGYRIYERINSVEEE